MTRLIVHRHKSTPPRHYLAPQSEDANDANESNRRRRCGVWDIFFFLCVSLLESNGHCD